MRMRDSRSRPSKLGEEDQFPVPAAQNENPNQANQTNHRNIAIIADTTTRFVILFGFLFNFQNLGLIPLYEGIFALNTNLSDFKRQLRMIFKVLFVY